MTKNTELLPSDAKNIKKAWGDEDAVSKAALAAIYNIPGKIGDVIENEEWEMIILKLLYEHTGDENANKFIKSLTEKANQHSSVHCK